MFKNPQGSIGIKNNIIFSEFLSEVDNGRVVQVEIQGKNIMMWAIIVFLTIGLYNMFKNPQSNVRGGNQIIFSEFLTSVDNGEVLKVEIQGNNIKGVYSNGNTFSTYSPTDPNLIEKLSDSFSIKFGSLGAYVLKLSPLE